MFKPVFFMLMSEEPFFRSFERSSKGLPLETIILEESGVPEIDRWPASVVMSLSSSPSSVRELGWFKCLLEWS